MQPGSSSLLLFIKNVQNRHGFACGLGVNTLHIFRKIQKPAGKTLEFCHRCTRATVKIRSKNDSLASQRFRQRLVKLFKLTLMMT